VALRASKALVVRRSARVAAVVGRDRPRAVRRRSRSLVATACASLTTPCSRSLPTWIRQKELDTLSDVFDRVLDKLARDAN
jgi:hypothetical protein